MTSSVPAGLGLGASAWAERDRTQEGATCVGPLARGRCLEGCIRRQPEEEPDQPSSAHRLNRQGPVSESRGNPHGRRRPPRFRRPGSPQRRRRRARPFRPRCRPPASRALPATVMAETFAASAPFPSTLITARMLARGSSLNTSPALARTWAYAIRLDPGWRTISFAKAIFEGERNWTARLLRLPSALASRKAPDASSSVTSFPRPGSSCDRNRVRLRAGWQAVCSNLTPTPHPRFPDRLFLLPPQAHPR